MTARLLRVPEVSEKLRVSGHKVRDLLNRGVLAGFRDGRTIRISEESVEALVSGRGALPAA